MQSTLLISATLFIALTIAQTNNYNIDYPEESKISTDESNFLTTVEANPAFQTDLAAVLAVAPASVVALAESNPDALLEDLASVTSTPAWISAIPTTILDSLATLLAKPLEADADVNAYLGSLLEEPGASSVLSVLMTNVPTTVQQAFESDSISFVMNFATATPLPAWASSVPAPIQSDLGSVINDALSIIDADLEGSALVAPTNTGSLSGFFPSVVSAFPTGTRSVVAPSATGSPIAFEGAAAPIKTAAAGAAALIGAAGVFFNL
ncbi:hypothetical protein ABVK25_001789 [Lepraria finkii]|uniref:Uncharacterized protein n=1 Tax=Lepraria finkii TaxID=1340010 RepID=A0ABR4BMV9_9LECA